MILVNLLPSQLRHRKGGTEVTLPKKQIGKIVFVLFLSVTAVFYVQYFISLHSIKGLRNRWALLQSDLLRVDKLRGELESGSKAEHSSLDKYVLSNYRTTEILSSISESIPDSIWLIELRVLRDAGGNTLVLKGAARSKKGRSSLQDIEKYLRDLKAKSPPNTELSLTTTRQEKEMMELTLFTAVFKWV